MTILVSLYSIVDALFISNFVGELAFSAVSVAAPVIHIISSIGHLVGAGGSAVIARTLGENKKEDANRYFTMLVIISVVSTIALSILALVFIEPIMRIAGASDLLIEDCITYGSILLIALPLCVLQSAFSKFLVVLEKPNMGLWVSVAAGISNVAFDYIFIVPLKMGVAGAAIATAIGYLIAGGVPILYILFGKDLKLRFTKTRLYGKVLGEVAVLGSSAAINNLSSSLIGILFNVQLMKLAGEVGVAAYGVMLYADFIFTGIFNGFTVGISPVISFHYGADNRNELKSLFRRCMIVVGVISVASVISSQLLAGPIAEVFLGKSPDTMQITIAGFRLFALMYLFAGISIFAAGLFAALSNGKISFGLSLLHTCILKGGFVLLLPMIWDVNGVWLSVVFADLITSAVSVIFLKTNREKYHY